MFEKFTSQDAADFRQRYQGTYGFFKQGDKKILVRLERINSERGQKSVEFVDKDSTKYMLYADSDDPSIGFEFLPPKIAYHNTKGRGTYLLKRIPHRQYLRGICDRNTAIATVLGSMVPVDFTFLGLLFGEKASVNEAFYEALTNKGKKERSFALSSQFAISLDKGMIYCLGRSIGNVSIPTQPETKLIIKLDDFELWTTEINDAARRADIKVEVS